MAAPVIFYSDFTSPHSYLAIAAVEDVARKHDREVDWRIVSLFQIWDSIGHQPLGKPRSKARYVRKDFERSARIAELPFTMPDSFPVDAVVARQAFYRLKKKDPALATAFAKSVFDRYWRDGKDIVFDETMVHWAKNDTDKTRIILFCDVTRPVYTPVMRGLNWLMMRTVIRATQSKNDASEKSGLFNRMTAYVYRYKMFLQKVKAANRPLYYTLKFAFILGLVYLIFLRGFDLV